MLLLALLTCSLPAALEPALCLGGLGVGLSAGVPAAGADVISSLSLQPFRQELESV